jgi:two-component system chemotaxis response regulator CheY
MFILRYGRAPVALVWARIGRVPPGFSLLRCTRGNRVTLHALIVDDSSAVRAFVRASLEDAEFARVQEAETGFEALRLLASNAFDVVIVDVNMPDINGLELLAFMKKSPRQQGAAKILISTQLDGSDAERGAGLGADAFLKKPFEVEELRELIRRLLGSAAEASR